MLLRQILNNSRLSHVMAFWDEQFCKTFANH